MCRVVRRNGVLARTRRSFHGKGRAAQTTVTLKHLAAALADSHEMAKKQSELILNDIVGMVVKHLKKGDRIRIGGLGILQVRKRAARMGRNPCDRRADQDQGEQEGRLPRRQGTQGSGLIYWWDASGPRLSGHSGQPCLCLRRRHDFDLN